jgi:hypothetical protein
MSLCAPGLPSPHSWDEKEKELTNWWQRPCSEVGRANLLKGDGLKNQSLLSGSDECEIMQNSYIGYVCSCGILYGTWERKRE